MEAMINGRKMACFMQDKIDKTARLATSTLQAWNFMELDLDMKTLQ